MQHQCHSKTLQTFLRADLWGKNVVFLCKRSDSPHRVNVRKSRFIMSALLGAPHLRTLYNANALAEKFAFVVLYFNFLNKLLCLCYIINRISLEEWQYIKRYSIKLSTVWYHEKAALVFRESRQFWNLFFGNTFLISFYLTLALPSRHLQADVFKIQNWCVSFQLKTVSSPLCAE